MKKRYILIGLVIVVLIITFSFFYLNQKTKVIYSSTGDFIIDSWGNGAPALTIAFPPEYVMTKNRASDFDVYRFNKPNSKAAAGIYLGHNPDSFNSNQNNLEIPSLIADKKIIWREWYESLDNMTVIRRETVISDFFNDTDTDYEGLLIHMFIAGYTPEDINIMQHSCETIRIKN